MAMNGVKVRRIRIGRVKARAAAAGDVAGLQTALVDTLDLLGQTLDQQPDPRRMRVNGKKSTTGKKWNRQQGE